MDEEEDTCASRVVIDRGEGSPDIHPVHIHICIYIQGVYIYVRVMYEEEDTCCCIGGSRHICIYIQGVYMENIYIYIYRLGSCWGCNRRLRVGIRTLVSEEDDTCHMRRRIHVI
jgi:hypothetical protein